MRAVIQRVRSAAVDIGDREHASIGRGKLVLVGIESRDTKEDAAWLAGKISRLRIFEDVEGRMNLDAAAVGGQFLVVSQFTLLADCRKGNRPSFIDAAPPDRAEALYAEFIAALASLGHNVRSGVFRASMQIRLINDGPVTIPIETPCES